MAFKRRGSQTRSSRWCEQTIYILLLSQRRSSLRRVNERSFILGHLLVALRATGSEFPKPADHEIPLVVLVVLPNGGVLHGQFPEE